MIEISAAGVVPAPAAAVFDFLADLRNHWALTGGRVELADPAADATRGGRVRMRGPLGIHREATTEVLEATRPSALAGRARLGKRTEARLFWRLDVVGERATRVLLWALVTSTGPWDGLLLRLGGRRWLERVFAAALGELARQEFPVLDAEDLAEAAASR